MLCITGSGSRPLDLLIDEPKKIISIDLNKTQNLLLELKIAAFKCLTYEGFSSFIGLSHSLNRITTFDRIKHELPQYARSYWFSFAKQCPAWLRYNLTFFIFSVPFYKFLYCLFCAHLGFITKQFSCF